MGQMISAGRLLCLWTCVLWAPLASAELDPPSVYISCISCHGERGEGNPVVPVPPIAGQHEVYLRAQLRAFRDGHRGAHPKDIWGRQMALMATPLTDDDIDRLAHFISQQPPWYKADQQRPASDHNTLACIGCHDSNAESSAGTAPLLWGMPEEYLYRQLTHYRDGLRANPVNGAPNPMSALISSDIADSALRDYARFFAGF